MRLRSVQAELATAGELDTRRARLQAAEHTLQETRAGNAFAENEVAVLRAKLEATEVALYGGSVRNPKELADLQHETESLKKHIAALDERLLEAMLALEAAEAEFSRARDELQAGENDWSHARQKLESAQSDSIQHLERLEGQREATMASVPASDLALYESVRKTYGGTAVAEILDACCGACGVAVAPSIAQTVRSNPELVRCRQCNRILYAG